MYIHFRMGMKTLLKSTRPTKQKSRYVQMRESYQHQSILLKTHSPKMLFVERVCVYAKRVRGDNNNNNNINININNNKSSKCDDGCYDNRPYDDDDVRNTLGIMYVHRIIQNLYTHTHKEMAREWQAFSLTKLQVFQYIYI